jgi:hypothetical protein
MDALKLTDPNLRPQERKSRDSRLLDEMREATFGVDPPMKASCQPSPGLGRNPFSCTNLRQEKV